MGSPENFTSTDEDPFEVLKEHGLRNLAGTPYIVLDYLTPVFLAIKIALFIVSIAFDLFLFYLIKFRFKELKTGTNYFLMHYCLTNAAFFFYCGVQIFIKKWGYDLTVFCLIFEVDDACLFLSFVFVTLLAFDWFVHSFKPHFLPSYNRSRKYLPIFVYLTGIVKFLITSSTCFFENILILRYNLLNVLYFVLFLVNVSLLILKCSSNIPIETYKTTYVLYLANFLIISWFPLFVYHYLIVIFIHKEKISLVLFFTKIFAEILAYSNSIILIFLLRYFDQNFRKAIHAFFEGTDLSDETQNLKPTLEDGSYTRIDN